MTRLAIGIVALVLALPVGIAHAGQISIKSDQTACDAAIPEGKAALVEARRSGNVVTLEVTALLNCANVPSKPELREWVNAGTVSLVTTSPSGYSMACLCAHKISFELTDLSKGIRTIYYVQDGTVLGHTDMP